MKTLTLTDDESIVLEELVGKALCGYTDEQTEEILTGLEEKFANLNSEESHRMKLQVEINERKSTLRGRR